MYQHRIFNWSILSNIIWFDFLNQKWIDIIISSKMTSKYIIITIHIRNLEILQLCGTKWMYISIFKSAILSKIVWKVFLKISLKGMNWYDFSKASFGFYMTWGFQNYAWFFRDIFWNSYFVQARCEYLLYV